VQVQTVFLCQSTAFVGCCFSYRTERWSTPAAGLTRDGGWNSVSISLLQI